MTMTHLYGPISNDTRHPGTTRQLLGGTGVCYWKQLINGMHLDRHLHCVEYVRLPPGASVGLHIHDRTEEIYYILRGSATMGINGAQWQVRAGDLITTPIGDRHTIANSSQHAMAFFVVEVYPASRGIQREPFHIPLRAQMQDGTALREANCSIRSVSLDLSGYLTGNWAECAIVEIPPAGRLSPYTRPRRDEVLFVVEGEADIAFGDDHISGGAGLCLSVPADLPRSIDNASSENPLELIWTEVCHVS